MASPTDICNLALLRLKSTLRIGNIDTDTSNIARVCQLLYPLVRDTFQASRPWNFNKVQANLVQVAQNPNLVWAFSYVYPADCLFFRRVQPAIGTPGSYNTTLPSNALVEVGQLHAPSFDTQQSAIKFEVANGLIYTNMPDAVGEYSQRNQNESTWPAPVVKAMSYQMAAELSPVVTDGDPFNMIDKMEALAKRTIDQAAAMNANERMRIQHDSEFTRER